MNISFRSAVIASLIASSSYCVTTWYIFKKNDEKNTERLSERLRFDAERLRFDAERLRFEDENFKSRLRFDFFENHPESKSAQKFYAYQDKIYSKWVDEMEKQNKHDNSEYIVALVILPK
jgi:hypothetical protein